MKRNILAGTFSLLAGAATLLLVAAIFYSCRRGGNPHHQQQSHDAPAEQTHSSLMPGPSPDGMRLSVPSAPPSLHRS